MSKKKFLTLASLMSAGAMLLNGCFGGLGGFWNGFFNGFPPNDLRWSIILDVLNEELFG